MMRLFFLDLISFLASVATHWQAYATGGVVTGAVNVFERLTKLRLTKKAYAGLFLVTFLLVAFFLAWRDERTSFRQTNQILQMRDNEIAQLNANITQLKRPNIGDPLVRVTHYEIYEEFFPLRVGKTFFARVDYTNAGQLTARDVKFTRYLTFGSYGNKAEEEPDCEPTFNAIYENHKTRMLEAGQDAFPSDPHWFTVDIKPLPTEDDVRGFRNRTRVPCFGVRFDWEGGHWSEFCAAMTPDRVWHHCPTHNESR